MDTHTERRQSSQETNGQANSQTRKLFKEIQYGQRLIGDKV